MRGLVKLLLSTGKVEVNSKERFYGRTPLSLAAIYGQKAVATENHDVVKLLQEYQRQVRQ